MRSYLRPRDWKNRPDENSQTGELPDEKRLAELERDTGMSRLSLQVYWKRGLRTIDQIQAHTHPSLSSLTSPMKIADMDSAVERLRAACEGSEKVLIYGDYDVDGTCGAALLRRVLGDFGFPYVEAQQPDRFKDGYGLNVGAVESASQSGIDLLVTVDCGITSFEALERAQELELDVIVVDHHQVDPTRGIPPAVAVVNPQREDCESGLRQLCGCGLAFYVAMALRSEAREWGWFDEDKVPNLKTHLDLVAMATAADMVPLIGDNRVLMAHGLRVLKETEKPGVRSLLEVCGIGSRDVSPGHLGFAIGPRINASGRLQSAGLALELLCTENGARAIELSQELDRLNRQRQDLQNTIWDEVREDVEKAIDQGRFEHAVVVGKEGWHEGVVGIVASRVTEMFRRPAIVMSFNGDRGKGSVRSYGGKNVLKALRECSEHLSGFGGHRFAAGLSLDVSQVEAFEKKFNAAVCADDEGDVDPPLLIDEKCELEDFDLKTMIEIERLGPFGPGNPEPVLAVHARVGDRRILKERHLKLSLVPVERGIRNPPIDAIWFHAAEREDVMETAVENSESMWAAVPEVNRWRGRATPSLRVKDWKSTLER